VHALGAGILAAEVQTPSDTTFRVFDFNRTDPSTGKPRTLHVDEALACIDFQRGPVYPVLPIQETSLRERLFSCPYFRLWRTRSQRRFRVGAAGECRIIIVLAGEAELQYRGQAFAMRPGSLLLLPADVGACECQPRGESVVLEAGLE